MDKNISLSRFAQGLAIFVGLLPLTVTFSQQSWQMWIETPFQYAVLGGQMAVALLLLITKLGRNQIVGLACLFLLVPFTFVFDEEGVRFLILGHSVNTGFSWLLAAILLGKLAQRAKHTT